MTHANRLSADIGGTFTDIVLEQSPHRLTHKTLTTPDAPERAVITGALALLDRAGVAPDAVDIFVHGTTLATNAVLERKGAATALICTQGFRDILEIGDESRFDQYDIFLQKPRPLIPRHLRLPVPERIDAAGSIVTPLDETAVSALIPVLREQGIASVAIALMHGYANDVHERRIADILAAALPDLYISLSSEVCPEIREYERTCTTCTNAYVQPVMSGYLGRLAADLQDRGFACPLYLMSSGGGLTTLDTARRFPVRLLESGPAGGAIFAAHIAREQGLERMVSFDMGGTTAKICLIEQGQPTTSRSFEMDRAARFVKGSGIPLRIPVIEMVEIGAGGGSIARVDTLRRVTVGPESAGSVPGPACYPNGGTHPTVTDANLTLGRLDGERFAGGAIALSPAAAQTALLADVGTPLGLDASGAAFAVCEIVEENMSNAVRVHTVEQGLDIATHAMMAFGGGAPLHAARMGEKLGIDTIIVPPNAGVGSAVGFLRAPVSYELVRSLYAVLDDLDCDAVNAAMEAMIDEAGAVVRPGAGDAPLTCTRGAYMRYAGQGHEIAVPLPDRPLSPDDGPALRTAFEAEYTRLFNRTLDAAQRVEVLTWTITVTTPAVAGETSGAGPAITHDAKADGHTALFDPQTGQMAQVPVYVRRGLSPGAHCPGPCLIVEDETTTFVSAAYTAAIDDRFCIVLTRNKEPSVRTDP